MPWNGCEVNGKRKGGESRISKPDHRPQIHTLERAVVAESAAAGAGAQEVRLVAVADLDPDVLGGAVHETGEDVVAGGAAGV